MRKVFLVGLFLFGLAILAFGIFNRNVVSHDSPISSGVLEEKVTVANNWFPKLDSDITPFDISAQSAVLVNYETGEIIYSKRSKDRLPAASTIKMMTALIALDSAKLTDVYTVSKKAAEIGEDTMGLTEGERVKVGDLLYGLMLPSGNDAAVTLAEGVAGSEDAFVSLMNKKVKGLGISGTKFINASGLDVDGEPQYSTAYDLAVIARYVWDKYPAFRKVAATDYIFIDRATGHKAYELYNDTNLLTTYPGVRGIKPGFTWEAGYCLVTYAENDGVKLIGVLLNSGDRRGEMTRLLDYGFSKYGVKVEHPQLGL